MFFAVRFQKNKADPFSWLPPASAAIAILVLAFRCYHATRGPFDYFADVLPTHLRFDSFLFGVLLSYYYHFAHEKFLNVATKYRALLFCLGVAGLAPAFILNLTNRFTYTFGFTLYYLAAGAVITAVLVTPFPHRNPVLRLFTYLGARSYSIYLWHMLVFMSAGPLLVRLPYSFAHTYIAHCFLLRRLLPPSRRRPQRTHRIPRPQTPQLPLPPPPGNHRHHRTAHQHPTHRRTPPHPPLLRPHHRRILHPILIFSHSTADDLPLPAHTTSRQLQKADGFKSIGRPIPC